ncbi:Fpg/Nei family DNA glycosylase [Salirhabdus salicampi]|uniref:Fpg/Nei family DNA glycosylase n=1 Tax=Salirhabdus salicampi TaxID=476102 RepID=UPI0020C4FAE6|nr:DNA-formamidopyrimidine glycosylase family protein [Salirhabdus salicampi]MCP8615401.1 endonuclease VIII [Salirhabdus salicampi]
MPELPEMENYRLLLKNKIEGKEITDVFVNREKSINVQSTIFEDKTRQQRICAIHRRAKQLLFYLDNGHVLLLHLMLGGWMFYGKEEDKPDRTIQIHLSFGEEHLYFIGLRLGYLHLFEEKEVETKLQDLGPEPLDINFSLNAFQDLVSNKRGRIKTTLVDQSFLSGIGNCYSDEICFHAKILPTRNMNDLAYNEIIQLYHSIRQVLQQATQYGGYMDYPLYKGDRKTGGVEPFLNVYDREGENCKRCGSKITKEEVSSRKCFYCKGCQK